MCLLLDSVKSTASLKTRPLTRLFFVTRNHGQVDKTLTLADKTSSAIIAALKTASSTTS